MARRSQPISPNIITGLKAVGILLVVAMGVGLIVSSVLWSNEVAALKKANNFTVTVYTSTLTSMADPRVISSENMLLASDNTITARTTVTEYPSYYAIDYVVAGSFRYNISTDQSQVVLSGMLPDAFPFPTVGSLFTAAISSLSYFSGGTTLMAGWFTTNAVSGLITDITIVFPFAYVGSTNDLVIILPASAQWVVYK